MNHRQAMPQQTVVTTEIRLENLKITTSNQQPRPHLPPLTNCSSMQAHPPRRHAHAQSHPSHTTATPRQPTPCLLHAKDLHPRHHLPPLTICSSIQAHPPRSDVHAQSRATKRRATPRQHMPTEVATGLFCASPRFSRLRLVCEALQLGLAEPPACPAGD